MDNQYSLRRARMDDGIGLRDFYRSVFEGEDVGGLAKTMLEKLPGLEPSNWFIIEDVSDRAIASALVMIPWELRYAGVQLKTAEMGIVGTGKKHRDRGLQRELNLAFDGDLESDSYDLAMIQGIPGFYGQFGYQYAIPLENHIELSLQAVGDKPPDCNIRPANVGDVAWLVEEDADFGLSFGISAARNSEDWNYLLTDSGETSYGSDFYVIENTQGHASYMRIPREGFGKGLIISEMSEGILVDEFQGAMSFCRKRADELQKPYIRINMHVESAPARLALDMGAIEGKPYAWQIKIPDKARFIRTITPALDSRLARSPMRQISGKFVIDMFTEKLCLSIKDGKVTNVVNAERSANIKADYSCRLCKLFFEAVVLGHRSVAEIKHLYPDTGCSGVSKTLVEILFPNMKSWIHERY